MYNIGKRQCNKLFCWIINSVTGKGFCLKMTAATEFNLFVSSLFWELIYIFFFVAISSCFLELLRHREHRAIRTACLGHTKDQSCLKHCLHQERRIKSGTRLIATSEFFPFLLLPFSLTTQQFQWAISGPDVTMRNKESWFPSHLPSFPLWLYIALHSLSAPNCCFSSLSTNLGFISLYRSCFILQVIFVKILKIFLLC